MKVLMLGWEFPPYISGGLGTACHGLTQGLSRHGVDIVFVVPRLFGGEDASHISLLEATNTSGQISGRSATKDTVPSQVSENFRTVAVPALLNPYWSPGQYLAARKALSAGGTRKLYWWDSVPLSELIEAMEKLSYTNHNYEQYGWDMFAEVARYTAHVVALMGDKDFDVIHAHDWMTYPAGIALSKLTGKPLVAHVHSLEYDRSGEHVNERINEIEGWGLHAADAVVAVSYYTRGVINNQHDVPVEKISVVHNGRYSSQTVQSYRREKDWRSKVVLFLGRITFQKGPDYFVEAAARVVPHVPDVTFVMAGAGDMLPRLIDRVHELGISNHFHFPGFLKGQDVERMFSLADVYVMPSVSEPFGISALEAIDFETPVVISRQSGVAEVLHHALKVDFWDVDRLAELIINALIHPELRADMVSMASEEIKRLHWEASALNMMDVYNSIIRQPAL